MSTGVSPIHGGNLSLAYCHIHVTVIKMFYITVGILFVFFVPIQSVACTIKGLGL